MEVYCRLLDHEKDMSLSQFMESPKLVLSVGLKATNTP